MIPSYYHESPSSAGLVGPQLRESARADSVHMVGGGCGTSPRLSPAHATECGEKPVLNLREPTVTPPQVSRLARRVHGWSWQAVGFLAQSRIVVLWLISSTVPRRHGHWRCLCYPVRPEAASADSNDRRDHFFLHQSLSLHPQRIDAPSPSIMCD
jgi:hypothetical protein